MRRFALIFATLTAVQAHDIITTKITFSKEISRLINKRCATCHHEGGSSLFANHLRIRPGLGQSHWRRSVGAPHASLGGGERLWRVSRRPRGLTQEELETISAWVEGGAPEGEPKYLPATPKMSAWQDPPAPKGSSEVRLADGTTLATSSQVLAIRPRNLKTGASVQIVAVRPDSSIEPLLWIYKYNPAFDRTYYYASPLKLPSGTRIEMSPSEAGSINLFVKHAGARVADIPARPAR